MWVLPFFDGRVGKERVGPGDGRRTGVVVSEEVSLPDPVPWGQGPQSHCVK